MNLLCVNIFKKQTLRTCKGSKVCVGVFDGRALVVLLFLLAGSIVTYVFDLWVVLLGRSVDDNDNDHDVTMMVCIVGRVV